jgi:hypothetical protein
VIVIVIVIELNRPRRVILQIGAISRLDSVSNHFVLGFSGE